MLFLPNVGVENKNYLTMRKPNKKYESKHISRNQREKKKSFQVSLFQHDLCCFGNNQKINALYIYIYIVYYQGTVTLDC